jgi:hypothetical protein
MQVSRALKGREGGCHQLLRTQHEQKNAILLKRVDNIQATLMDQKVYVEAETKALNSVDFSKFQSCTQHMKSEGSI